MAFFHRKHTFEKWNLSVRQPFLRKSICTGEMVVGFIDRASGQAHEVMMVPGDAALDDFLKEIGADRKDLKILY